MGDAYLFNEKEVSGCVTGLILLLVMLFLGPYFESTPTVSWLAMHGQYAVMTWAFALFIKIGR